MRNNYFLFISPGFALLAACGAAPVRKHAVSEEMVSPEGNTNFEGVADSTSLARVEPREDIMNFEGVAAPLSELSSSLVRKTKSFEHADIPGGLTGSTFTRSKTPKREIMEVHANGHIEPPARVMNKMTSQGRVLELQSESHADKQRRIYELEAELEAAKAACAESDRVKFTHGLLESNVDEPKAEVIDGETYQVVSESVRWAATQELVKLYYGGSFDLLQTDLHRNRKVQPNPVEFDAGEAIAEKKGNVHMQPAAVAMEVSLCDEEPWPDKRNGLVCGDCKVLVNRFSSRYWSCSTYCAAVGRTCTGAWEEVANDCSVKFDMTCDQTLDTSDAICECMEEAAYAIIIPSTGACPTGLALSESQCSALDGTTVGGIVVDYHKGGTWDHDTCGCYFNSRSGDVYFNRHPSGCTPDSDEIAICHTPKKTPGTLGYEISAFNVSDCPGGTYRIESGNACATAALSLGRPYQFMGQATYHSHPRGCSVDSESKITFNFARHGFPSMSEKLLCAKSKTCATHRCPEGQQHKVDADNLANPTDGACCEQKAVGANCIAYTLCEEELGKLRYDSSFMCECVRNHESQRNKTLCEQWLMCLHNKRGMVQVWFKELLEFVRADTMRTGSTALVQSSSNAKDADCTDPSLVDVFSLDCQCAGTLQEACGGWIDRQQCLIEFACASDEVCDTWKRRRCANASAESVIEGRLDSRAGSMIGIGSRQATDASVHVGRGEDGYYLDEAVQRKCR